MTTPLSLVLYRKPIKGGVGRRGWVRCIYRNIHHDLVTGRTGVSPGSPVIAFIVIDAIRFNDYYPGHCLSTHIVYVCVQSAYVHAPALFHAIVNIVAILRFVRTMYTPIGQIPSMGPGADSMRPTYRKVIPYAPVIPISYKNRAGTTPPGRHRVMGRGSTGEVGVSGCARVCIYIVDTGRARLKWIGDEGRRAPGRRAYQDRKLTTTIR